MATTKNYEMIILLSEDFNDNELKNWAFEYAQELQKLNASEISVISRGKRLLAYTITRYKKANFIQINFKSTAKSSNVFSNNLKFDQNVLRYSVFNKN